MMTLKDISQEALPFLRVFKNDVSSTHIALRITSKDNIQIIQLLLGLNNPLPKGKVLIYAPHTTTSVDGLHHLLLHSNITFVGRTKDIHPTKKINIFEGNLDDLPILEKYELILIVDSKISLETLQTAYDHLQSEGLLIAYVKSKSMKHQVLGYTGITTLLPEIERELAKEEVCIWAANQQIECSWESFVQKWAYKAIITLGLAVKNFPAKYLITKAALKLICFLERFTYGHKYEYSRLLLTKTSLTY